MKYLFSAGLVGMFLILALLGFWRVHVARTAVETGVLSGKVDALVALWNSQGVAEKDRVIDFVISDSESGTDPFALSSDEKPSAWSRLGDWFDRTFLRSSMAAKEDSQFVQAFADDPAAVTWTHDGFATASEAEMTQEVMKAIVKAHDAGAEINIVAQGVSAPPVLNALKKLEGTERAGAKVGANKVVLTGWNQARLKRIPSMVAYDFNKLGNIIELASVWVPKEEFVKTTKMHIFSRGRAGAEVELEKLWPQIPQDSKLTALMQLVKGLVRQVAAMEQIINQQAQAIVEWEAKKATEEAARAAEEAKKAAEESARKGAEAKRLAEEAARKPKKFDALPNAAAIQQELAREQERLCAKCCSDLGGMWQHTSDNGVWAYQRGCCRGDTGFTVNVESCHVAFRQTSNDSHGDCNNTPGRFRCVGQ